MCRHVSSVWARLFAGLCVCLCCASGRVLYRKYFIIATDSMIETNPSMRDLLRQRYVGPDGLSATLWETQNDTPLHSGACIGHPSPLGPFHSRRKGHSTFAAAMLSFVVAAAGSSTLDRGVARRPWRPYADT
jgi:hypothetical protein